MKLTLLIYCSTLRDTAERPGEWKINTVFRSCANDSIPLRGHFKPSSSDFFALLSKTGVFSWKCLPNMCYSAKIRAYTRIFALCDRV